MKKTSIIISIALAVVAIPYSYSTWKDSQREAKSKALADSIRPKLRVFVKNMRSASKELEPYKNEATVAGNLEADRILKELIFDAQLVIDRLNARTVEGTTFLKVHQNLSILHETLIDSKYFAAVCFDRLNEQADYAEAMLEEIDAKL